MPMQTNLDLDLVRTFVTVVESRSFSRAGERLLRNQSTISLQIKRMEDDIGKRLLERTSKQVNLTAEGETFLPYARRLLALNDEIVAKVSEPHVSGVVRLGAPEDFATHRLPDVLARFARSHPGISLEVTCDLTLNLLDGFRAGAYDLVLVKREPRSIVDGVRVWREPLVWATGGRDLPPEDMPLQLVVSPDPCVYRKRATTALDRARRTWHIAYTCASLAGSQAAVRAGLGITVLPRDMVPPGLRVIDGGALPSLDDTEIALMSAEPLNAPARRLADHIVRALEQRPPR